MDIFSHGLWAGAAGSAINLKIKKPLKIRWLVFWGVFPDLFSFALLFVWLIISRIIGRPDGFPGPEQTEPMRADTSFIFQLTSTLYSISHSLIIFLAVFIIVYLIFKKPAIAMLGWLMHILIDIPTHSYQFYPTPLLWPVSGWKFNGLSWTTPWFLIVNYLVLILVYLTLFILKRRRRLDG